MGNISREDVDRPQEAVAFLEHTWNICDFMPTLLSSDSPSQEALPWFDNEFKM